MNETPIDFICLNPINKKNNELETNEKDIIQLYFMQDMILFHFNFYVEFSMYEIM